MRQSVAANRTSLYPQAHANSAALNSKLLEKKKEYDAVSALERASNSLLERMMGIDEDCNIMANAGEIHGQVLEQWPRMFQILSLFLAQRDKIADANVDSDVTADLEGNRLVRIPFQELREASTPKQA
ncbi:hypothetical protein FISHEDRAFT_33996 [Fistulina hepatica ATCC 64428]|uniref:DASH complex subunit DAD2 n=1 Tax=Fistulina hepatica ATCC 64428 TaxID=1128425 RepID=A0A0D7AMI8_9AGAR|nr:hypothetical protein FISHEDRAFT_33996 [Fistulina hepatica ATCC 64428]